MEVTQIHEGNLFWVASVNQDKQRQGWIAKDQISWSAPLVDTYLQPTADRPFKYEESRDMALSRAQELKEVYNELRSLFESLPNAPSLPVDPKLIPNEIPGFIRGVLALLMPEGSPRPSRFNSALPHAQNRPRLR